MLPAEDLRNPRVAFRATPLVSATHSRRRRVVFREAPDRSPRDGAVGRTSIADGRRRFMLCSELCGRILVGPIGC